MKQKNNKIRIAIQNNGRLRESSLEFLRSLGLKFEFAERSLITPCLNADIDILSVRNGDIPKYLKNNSADYGIVGENVLIENRSKLKIMKRLGFGLCSLVIAVPKKSKVKSPFDLRDERIATSYKNTLKTYLKKNRINASIVNIQGSVEICPALNLSDAICDITQSGSTLKENGLKVLEKILDSEAVLVKNPYISQQKKEYFEKFMKN